MAKHPSALSHLKPDELKTLLIKITAYALRKLGTRAGHSPEMQADDLTHRAIEDTLSGQRRWNHEHNTLEQHLTGTINSYISHYFESLAAKSVSHTNGAEPQAQNPPLQNICSTEHSSPTASAKPSRLRPTPCCARPGICLRPRGGI